MFSELMNEATLTFTLRNEGPLMVNSGSSAKIHPGPDMSFVRTLHNGRETIYLPGSSIKGVFRSRYEQLMRSLGQNVCETFEADGRIICSKKIEAEEKRIKKEKSSQSRLTGEQCYKLCCEACKLFGSLKLGGRISFADAYPTDEEWKVGMRHGVGIDRITGASKPGALFDLEVLEDGAFTVSCKMVNFRLYQLRTILWIVEDIQEGLVTFGMGGSRGNGQMRIVENREFQLTYRKYDRKYGDAAPELGGEEKEALFGKQVKIDGLSQILEGINIRTRSDLISAIAEGR